MYQYSYMGLRHDKYSRHKMLVALLDFALACLLLVNKAISAYIY